VDDKITMISDVWRAQALWMSVLYRVGTCSNRIAGFHRFINEAVSSFVYVVKRLDEMVRSIVQKYENGCEYSHRQGRKLIKKMIAEQCVLEIEPVTTCTDAKCGWGAFYVSVLGVPWFPCVHEVRSA
jgi:hypothetical protein